MFFMACITLCFNSCKDGVELEGENTTAENTIASDFKTGTIVYSVDFPFFKDKKLKRFLPKKYSLSVTDDKMYGEMNSYANLICNRFYISHLIMLERNFRASLTRKI